MHSTTQLLASRLPSFGITPTDERAVDHDEEPCAICGGGSTHGVPLDEFIGDSLTDQNTFKSLYSKHVCLACAFVRGRLSQVPGRLPKPCDLCDGTGLQPDAATFARRVAAKNAKRKPKRSEGEVCEKCDGTKLKESGGRFANFSHFLDDDRTENATKGEKPKILGWLRGPKKGFWACAIADTGQKHVLPYTPLNPPGARGRVRFEEAEIRLPDAAGWCIVDDMIELLTAGATKDEIESGNYGARAWQLCGAALRAFEAAHGRHRGGAWFALSVWLAQRDEERVAERMESEKAAAAAKKEAARGRGKARKASDSPGRDASGVSTGVPANKPGKGARALADPARPDADQRPQLEERGRVGDGRGAPSTDPATGQALLFDLAGPVQPSPGARRVAGDEKPDRQGARPARGAGKKAGRDAEGSPRGGKNGGC